MLKTTVEYWDTPFAMLEGNVASDGIPVKVREPLGDGTFGLRAALAAASLNASATSVFTNDTYSQTTITDSNGNPVTGRVATLVNYWAGGAPGQHGASVKGKIAYHFHCVLRPVAGRSWWSQTTNPNFTLAFGGNGYVRIDKTVGATVTTLYSGDVKEETYLTSGLYHTAAITDMGPGDSLDIYYVQDENFSWGGYVFKAVPLYPVSGTTAEQLEADRNAPIISCGLFDSGTQPTRKTLTSYGPIEVNRSKGRVVSATIEIPLVNTQLFDGVGYEFVKQTDDDPGSLKLYQGSATSTTTIKRQRLIRISGGFTDIHGNDEVYITFTGFVDDFTDPKDGKLSLQCVGFEQRLLDQFMKNYPDRISYMAHSYLKRSGTSEPVYDLPCYDNWHMEYALRDLLVRSGLCESLTRQALTVTPTGGTPQPVIYGDQAYSKFRARSMGQRLLRLERPVHYGNAGAGYNSKKKPDDAYIFTSESTRDVWATCRDMVERYGYDLQFDEFGHAALTAQNNPSYIVDLSTTLLGSGTKKTHPNAYAGTYIEWTAGTPSVVQTYKASRIDLIIPRLVNAGTWNFTVVSGVTTVSSGTINPALPSGYADEFFYDFRTTSDGSNSCVVTLYTGEFATYTVTLTASANDGKTRRLDSFLLWATDPLLPRFDHLFSTQENALEVLAQGTMTDMRNLVTVVGRRIAAVTDSTKLNTNPNNPESEFIVQTAVDVNSILDPSAPNYLGYNKESIIYDNRVTDMDFAGYLASSFIYRYRLPRPGAQLSHTILPLLRLGEPLYGVEETYQTVTADSTLWVTGMTHRFETNKATTQIQTTSYVPIPAYEPREDIDIDADFGGHPVINLAVTYRSLDDATVTSPGTGAVVESLDTGATADIVSVTKSVTVGSPNYIDMTGELWPPVPGTVFLFPEGSADTAGSLFVGTVYQPPAPTGIGGGTGVAGQVALNGTIISPALDGLQRVNSVNLIAVIPNPMFPGHFMTKTVILNTTPIVKTSFDPVGEWYYEVHKDRVVAIRVNGTPPTNNTQNLGTYTLSITWYQAANSSTSKAIANTPYHHYMNVDYRTSNRKIYLPWKEGDGSATYSKNDLLSSYVVKYRKLYPQGYTSDPYSGACPFYDPYTSELGYLTTWSWDCLVSGLFRIAVRSVYDDTVVAYLTEPTADPDDEEAHWQYFTAGANRQLSWDGVDNVGTWNKRQSHLASALAHGAFEREEQPVVGKGFYVWNREQQGNGQLGPLGFISGQLNADTGKPIFGQGTYACWYLSVEALVDRLGETARKVTSKALDPDFNATSEALIYTHLPEPTHIEISEIADFTESQLYDEDNPPTSDSGFWQTLPTTGAVVNNQKPVRLRYTMCQRPGLLWAGNKDKAGVKLTEVVHLAATIHDQLIVFDTANYANSTVPKRTVVNRRFVNNEHTVEFVDKNYTLGTDFKTTTGGEGREWVFLPKDFKKDFGDGFEDSLRYMDFLQIEELPYWDETRQIAGKHSRHQIAFMNYLFYLSTFTQDRSGRMVWAINPKFVDCSKIIKNTWGDWWDPANPTTPATSSTYRAEYPVDMTYQHQRTVICRQWQDEAGWISGQTSDFALTGIGVELLRHKWSDHDPATTTINGSLWSSMGCYLDQHSKWHADGRNQLPSTFLALNRQLGDSSNTVLGDWTWESSPNWVPCITRDFHPYFMLPPMVDVPPPFALLQEEVELNKNYLYLLTDNRDYDANANTGSDAAASQVWNSPVTDMTEVYSSGGSGTVRFWPGEVVDPQAGAFKDKLDPVGPKTNVMDYIRQDDLMHWEDFRGIYSRSARPAMGIRKVTPAAPYYINPFGYKGITVEENTRHNRDYGTPGYPLFRAENFAYALVTGWFDMKFRHEYFWQSGTMFPTDHKGVEYLAAANATKSRMVDPKDFTVLRYDDGAWVGWKDDVLTATRSDSTYKLYFRNRSYDAGNAVTNVFHSGYMPVGVGPRLRTPDGTLVTQDMLFSMVLVSSRRENPV